MVTVPEPSTEVSLLQKVRRDPADQDAWRRFDARDGPLVHGWCRHWGAQEADAQDVTQTVLAHLAGRLKTFEYDPARRFRGWLRTVARHAWAAFVAGREKEPAGTGDSDTGRLLHSVEARDDLARRLQEEFDQELLEVATRRVQACVEPRTWEAFLLTARERLPAADVATRVGMKVATVYVARSKVQRLLREELRRLEEGPP
jgi:RNA polymerase sigma-70 factor (ECF subfamily)